MKVEISGHHVEVTDAMREAVIKKFQKISSHYPDVKSLSIILNVEKNEQTIDVKTQFMGTTVNVKASNQDLYAAISDAVKKMDAALKNRKGSAKSHLYAKPVYDEEDPDSRL